MLSPAFELLSADSEPCSEEGSTRELFLYSEMPEVLVVKAWEQGYTVHNDLVEKVTSLYRI